MSDCQNVTDHACLDPRCKARSHCERLRETIENAETLDELRYLEHEVHEAHALKLISTEQLRALWRAIDLRDRDLQLRAARARAYIQDMEQIKMEWAAEEKLEQSGET